MKIIHSQITTAFFCSFFFVFFACSSDPGDSQSAQPSSSSEQTPLLSSSMLQPTSSSSEQTSPSSSSTQQPPSSSSVQSSLPSSSSATDGQDLVRKNITLSYAGNSYADIDGNITTHNQTTVASRLDKIELIAYCGTDIGWCEYNSIYSPWEIDLFWTDNYDDYLGGDVFFLEISDEQAAIFKTATKLSEVIPTVNSLINTFDGIGVDEIPIVKGKAFFVYTSEEEVCIVVIKETGNQSVDLEIIKIPRE
jgi:hypothetical protein